MDRMPFEQLYEELQIIFKAQYDPLALVIKSSNESYANQEAQ